MLPCGFGVRVELLADSVPVSCNHQAVSSEPSNASSAKLWMDKVHGSKSRPYDIGRGTGNARATAQCILLNVSS